MDRFWSGRKERVMSLASNLERYTTLWSQRNMDNLDWEMRDSSQEFKIWCSFTVKIHLTLSTRSYKRDSYTHTSVFRIRVTMFAHNKYFLLKKKCINVANNNAAFYYERKLYKNLPRPIRTITSYISYISWLIYHDFPV